MSMKPLKLPLVVYQGATFDYLMTWKVGSPAAPVDLTGCTGRMQVREAVAAPEVLLELTSANGRLVLGGAAGTVRLLLTAEETAALAWRKGVYDLEVVFADGTVRRLVEGGLSVSPEVTR